MRHCMIVHSHYPIGEPRVEREARALRQRGYEVDVICLRSAIEKAFEQVDGVRVFRLPVQRRRGRGPAMQMLEYLAFFILAFFRVSGLQLARRYESVQIHNLPDFLVFTALLPKLAGARVLLDLHDLMPEFYASSFHAEMCSTPIRLLILQEKLACRFADHVITVTDLWRRTLIDRGVPADKVSVVMNVADDSVFNRTLVPVTGVGEEPALDFRLIYHGTLAYRYGIDLILEAVALIQNQISGIHLTIHGRGDFIEDLRAQAARLGIEKAVTFSTQYVPIEEVPKIIRQAALGIVPYRRDIFTDGILPTKLMEYVALGIPVLAADTPIIREYFDESMVQYFQAGDAGDLAHKLFWLSQHREVLAELSANADRFFQQYSWSRVAESYANTLDRLTGQLNPA
ncbi:MAG TPA: glycosyltransferase family 4 protein [Anaerolineaceae bacterium]|nr:glycosyltransferase family 4 protein [Anaerolineaceae bacterium]